MAQGQKVNYPQFYAISLECVPRIKIIYSVAPGLRFGLGLGLGFCIQYVSGAVTDHVIRHVGPESNNHGLSRGNQFFEWKNQAE